jgi:hypothetical protein
MEMSQVADVLQRTSALVIRDPRVTFEDNSTFLDVIEKYFEQPYEVKMKDVRPELHYQVGPTPEGTENPRCVADEECHKLIASVRRVFAELAWVVMNSRLRFASLYVGGVCYSNPLNTELMFPLVLMPSGDSSIELALARPKQSLVS